MKTLFKTILSVLIGTQFLTLSLLSAATPFLATPDIGDSVEFVDSDVGLDGSVYVVFRQDSGTSFELPGIPSLQHGRANGVSIIAKMSSQGRWLWAKAFSGTYANLHIWAIDIFGEDLAIGGHYKKAGGQSILWETTTIGIFVSTPLGSEETGFVARLDSDGRWNEGESFINASGSVDSRVTSVAIDSDRGIKLGGTYTPVQENGNLQGARFASATSTTGAQVSFDPPGTVTNIADTKHRRVPFIASLSEDLRSVKWAHQFMSNVMRGFESRGFASESEILQGHISKVVVDGSETYFVGRVSGDALNTTSNAGVLLAPLLDRHDPANFEAGELFVQSPVTGQPFTRLKEAGINVSDQWVINTFVLGRVGGNGEITGMNFSPDQTGTTNPWNGASIATDIVITPTGGYITGFLTGNEVNVNPHETVLDKAYFVPPGDGFPVQPGWLANEPNNFATQRGFIFRFRTGIPDILPVDRTAVFTNGEGLDGTVLPIRSRADSLTASPDGRVFVSGASIGQVSRLRVSDQGLTNVQDLSLRRISPGTDQHFHFVLGLDEDLSSVGVSTPADKAFAPLSEMTFPGSNASAIDGFNSETGRTNVVAGPDPTRNQVFWGGSFTNGRFSIGNLPNLAQSDFATTPTPYLTGLDVSNGGLDAQPFLQQVRLRINNSFAKFALPNSTIPEPVIRPEANVDHFYLTGSEVTIELAAQVVTDFRRDPVLGVVNGPEFAYDYTFDPDRSYVGLIGPLRNYTWPDLPRTRHIFQDYEIQESSVTSTENVFDLVLTDDVTLRPNYLTEHALDTVSLVTQASNSDPVIIDDELRVLGNPSYSTASGIDENLEVGTAKPFQIRGDWNWGRTWIQDGERVQIDVGLETTQNLSFGERFVVSNYVGRGALQSSLSEFVQSEAFSPDPFDMTGPVEFEINWKKQILIQLGALTEPAARDRVYVKAVNRVTTGSLLPLTSDAVEGDDWTRPFQDLNDSEAAARWFDYKQWLFVAAERSPTGTGVGLDGWLTAGGHFRTSQGTLDDLETTEDVREDERFIFSLETANDAGQTMEFDQVSGLVIEELTKPTFVSWNYGGAIFPIFQSIGLDVDAGAINTGRETIPMQTVTVAEGQMLDTSRLSGDIDVNADPVISIVESPAPGTSSANAIAWDSVHKRLLPLRPGRFLVQFPAKDLVQADANANIFFEITSGFPGDSVSEVVDDDSPLITTFPLLGSDWPRDYKRAHYRHILGAPGVPLDASLTDAFAFNQLAYFQADALTATAAAVPTAEAAAVSDGRFTSGLKGRSVLVFSQSNLPDDPTSFPATGNTESEGLVVRVVETRWLDDPSWDNTGDIVSDGGATVVGTPVSDTADEANLGTGWVVLDSPKLLINPNIYDRSVPEGPIIPVNTAYRLINSVDEVKPEEELIITWYENLSDETDSDPSIDWPYQPKIYLSFNIDLPGGASYSYTGRPSPNSNDRFGSLANQHNILYTASRMGSAGLKFTDADGWVAQEDLFAKYEDIQIYHQPDREAQGYNPNEEHAFIADAIFSHPLDENGDPLANEIELGNDSGSAKAVFALRDDLNVNLRTVYDETTTLHDIASLDLSTYTSEPYVLVQYYDPEIEEHRMALYFIGHESEIYEYEYETTVGIPIRAPYPVDQLVGFEGNDSDQLDNDDDIDGTYFVNAEAASIGREQAVFWFDPVGVPWAISGPVALDSTSLDDTTPHLYAGFYYNLRDDFWHPTTPAGEPVPWLSSLVNTNSLAHPPLAAGAPTPIRYNTVWPDEIATLKAGETLTFPGGEFKKDHPTLRNEDGELVETPGLPGTIGWAAGRMLFDSRSPAMREDLAAPENFTARLVNPLLEHAVPLAIADVTPTTGPKFEPADDSIRVKGTRWFFNDLSASLQRRVSYDFIMQKLTIQGFVNERAIGDANLTAAPDPVYVLEPNILTLPEAQEMAALYDHANWLSAVNSLYHLSRDPNGLVADEAALPTADEAPYLAGLNKKYGEQDEYENDLYFDVNERAPAASFGPGLAVVPNANFLEYDPNARDGYITLVENAHPENPDLSPVTIHVIKVTPHERYRGAIKTVLSDNVFDEKIVLKHTSDFGGNLDDVEYEWYYKPAEAGDVGVPLPGNGWTKLSSTSNQITLAGEPKLLLGDNLFFARYKHVADFDFGDDVNDPFPWEWAGAGNSPQVQTDLSTKYLPQLAMGWVKRVLDRVNPYEARFNDFYNNESPATYTSLIQQAGAPPLGPVALNPDKNVIENLGLIELYKTVLDRAVNLSIETTAGNASIQQALLLGATRISFLYDLLGNEAYSDAQDPTIGIQGGNLAPTVHAFQNLEASLLHEELALLRGTDFDMGWPVYNRLFWNFVKGEGEPAYAVNYNIKDVTSDGFINESDAKLLFPQGHGDAWGHYLSASKSLYTLLRHPRFNWQTRQELYNLLDLVLETDYLDERSFARIAANKARAGADIVHNTYRLRYEQDPDGQWHGYRDTDEARAWGVSESATRAYQGSYFDWLTTNSLLPYDARGTDDSSNQLDLIDRRSTTELKELATLASEIQNTMDNANNGLNPLGLVDGDVTFDINPSILGREFVSNSTHFEQLFQRAVQAGKNATVAFEHASKQQNRLRDVANSTESTRREASSQDRSYRNRLIELFGTPYEGTVGPGELYPAGYDGPDLILFQYVDFNSANDFIPDDSQAYRELFTYQLGGEFGLNGLFKTALGVAGLQNENYSLETLISDFTNLDGAKPDENDENPPSTRDRVLAGSDFTIRDADGNLIDLKVPIDPKAFYGFKAPDHWGKRRVVGTIQQRIHDLVSTQISLTKSLDDYESYLRDLKTSISNHQASWGPSARGIRDQQLFLSTTTIRETAKAVAETTLEAIKTTKTAIDKITSVTISGLPTVVGVSSDIAAPARAALLAAKIAASQPLEVSEVVANAVDRADKLAETIAAEGLKLRNQINSFKGAQRSFVYSVIGDLASESTNRYPIANALADMQKRIYAFDAEVDKGVRLIAEREAANKKVAAVTQEGRYNDAILRINRNEALQHYHGALDTAIRYAYSAAQAYDYETGLAPEDPGSVHTLLPELMRTRSLGLWSGGQPQMGRGGLGEWLGRLKANHEVLKTQLGLTNPQKETGRLSLRHEWARVKPEVSSDERWRKTLANHRVTNLWEVPEFRQYCRPFAREDNGAQPGLVIPMSSEITSGLNFFGQELGGLDHAYDPSQYATKIASVGAWFTGYDETGLALTPRIYLVPAGADIMRIANSPTLETREWLVRDRKIPIPYPVASSDLENPDWLLSGSSIDGTFTDIRRFSAFRAYHDQGSSINEGEITYDSRLIGRSVWNTRWVLIIPGAAFSADPDLGLDRFIGSENAPGVSDIKLLLQTYSHSGN